MITDEQIEDLKNNKGSRYLYDVDHPYSNGVPTVTVVGKTGGVVR
jgi:hypothetical protein